MKAALVSLVSWLSGCVYVPARVNEVDRLIAYPGFQDAGKAAPGWTVEALDTVDRLQRELATLR